MILNISKFWQLDFEFVYEYVLRIHMSVLLIDALSPWRQPKLFTLFELPFLITQSQLFSSHITYSFFISSSRTPEVYYPCIEDCGAAYTPS